MTLEPSQTTASGRAGSSLVVALDVGGTKCHGVLADMDGTIVADDLRETGSDAYATILSCLGQLRGVSQQIERRVIAVAIGVPAIVEPESGRVHGGPNVGWTGFDLGSRLSRDVGLPFVIENDAHLAAIGEARRGGARGVDDFVIVSIGTGIGAAAVVGGRLVTGRHNAAGEIGSMVLDRAWLAGSPPGGHGWFESVASGPAIGSHATGPDGTRGSTPSVTAESVFAAMHAGEPEAIRVVDGFLDHLAMALIAVTGVLDPELVILDGGVGKDLGWAVDTLAGRVARHTPIVPRIAVSTLQPTAALVGATIAAVESVNGAGFPAHHFGTFARSLIPAES